MSQALKKMTNEEIVELYGKTCVGVETIYGVHPLSFAYGDVQKALKKELLRRMNPDHNEKGGEKHGGN